MQIKSISHVILLLIINGSILFSQDLAYRVETAHVHFKSDAPLEIIEASSSALRGVIDTNENTFAFTIDMTTFEGFNSSLQKTHFNENYLESGKYPKASFFGKIIEHIKWNSPGEYTIRAKGVLEIHGQQQERIIKSRIEIGEVRMKVESQFSVMLKEHNITIPKIVSQKIAEKILVDVSASFATSPKP